MIKNKINIRSMLILTLIFCSVMPMMLITTMGLQYFDKQIRAMSEENIKSIAKINKNYIENYFVEKKNELRNLTKLPVIKNMIVSYYQDGYQSEDFKQRQEEAADILMEHVHSSEAVLRMSIITNKNETLLIADPHVDESTEPEIPYHIFTNLAEQNFISEILTNPLINEGRDYTVIAVPSYDSNNNVNAYIIQVLDNGYFDTIAKAAKFLKTGGICILNRNGQVITSSFDEKKEDMDVLITEFNEQQNIQIKWKESRFYERLQTYPESKFHYSIDGKEKIAYYLKMPIIKWSMICYIDKSELTEIVDNSVGAMPVILFILIVISSIAYILAYRYFMTPTKKLAEAIQRLQSGNEDTRVEYKADNEFGKLAKAFNDLMDKNHRVNLSLQMEERKYKRAIAVASEIIYEINLTEDIFLITNATGDYEPDVKCVKYSKNIIATCEKYVLPEWKEVFLNSLSYESLYEKFSQNKDDEVIVEYKRYNQYGAVTWLRNTVVCVSDPTDETIWLLMYITDIDEINLEKELEKAREIENAKNMFLANVSHEIRTPINAIIGMTHLLKKTEPNEKQRDFIFKIENSSNILIGIVNDILDLSKMMTNHKISLNPEPFRLSDISETVENMFRNKAKEKAIELIIQNEFRKDLIVKTDKIRLSQIMINLVSNAVKFTDIGEVTFRIESLSENMENVTIQFTVKDTGVGISAEEQDKIWQEFHQADGTLTKNYQGTGLGLAITKRIVERLEGRIWIESELDEGTEFHVLLELKKAGESELEKHSQKMEPQEDLKQDITQNQDKRILLVEDNEINKEITQMIIKELGYVCDSAYDGLEALEAYSDKPEDYYSIIITDINMPRMDGYELAEKLRQQCANCPIIALTATIVDNETKARYTGIIDDYLSKPVKPNEISEKISKYI